LDGWLIGALASLAFHLGLPERGPAQKSKVTTLS
jgi:hypothetical protein